MTHPKLQALLDRRARVVGALFPLSPAAASFVEAAGHVTEVPTFHLYRLRAMLRRERQYLPPTKQLIVTSILTDIDNEIKERGRA